MCCTWGASGSAGGGRVSRSNLVDQARREPNNAHTAQQYGRSRHPMANFASPRSPARFEAFSFVAMATARWPVCGPGKTSKAWSRWPHQSLPRPSSSHDVAAWVLLLHAVPDNICCTLGKAMHYPREPPHADKGGTSSSHRASNSCAAILAPKWPDANTGPPHDNSTRVWATSSRQRGVANNSCHGSFAGAWWWWWWCGSP